MRRNTHSKGPSAKRERQIVNAPNSPAVTTRAMATAVNRSTVPQRPNPYPEKIVERWIVSDITLWRPARTYDVWHDRAVFHFLTDPKDQAAYIGALTSAVATGGYAVIATFAPDGPETCSGLPVARYSPELLSETLGSGFFLIDQRFQSHTTPWGHPQSFQYSLFRRG